jgi:hypothetical protein
MSNDLHHTANEHRERYLGCLNHDHFPRIAHKEKKKQPKSILSYALILPSAPTSGASFPHDSKNPPNGGSGNQSPLQSSQARIHSTKLKLPVESVHLMAPSLSRGKKIKKKSQTKRVFQRQRLQSLFRTASGNSYERRSHAFGERRRDRERVLRAPQRRKARRRGL